MTDHTVLKAASVAVPAAAFSWFADTLPVMQWFAAVAAILAATIGIYRAVRKK
jgi:hypothetical protein